MVTNRRKIDGQYGDEEMPNRRFEYQYDHDGGAQGQDGFRKHGKRGFETALLQELCRLRDVEGISTPKVGIYIHGFNNPYQESIDELYDLHNSLTPILGYSPVLVGFSWPSRGNVVSYMADREEVRDSAGAFTRFLLDLEEFIRRNEEECFSTTFCMAHSLGNYMLRKGLEYLSDYLGDPVGRMLFDEAILVSPDITSQSIELDGKGRYIANFSRRVHAYYSKHDRALKASSAKRFGGNRLGRHGADDYYNLRSNTVVVDTAKYANSESMDGLTDRAGGKVSVHSAPRYHASILADIAQVISSIDRDQITGRESYKEEGLPMSNHFKLV